MRTPFTGVGTALITPFTRTGDLDEGAIRRLASRQIEGGVHFLVPCGTTGETPTLSDAERRRVVELVVDEAAGRVPVMAGAGGYDTREVVQAARAMRDAGAQGLLSVTPYYNRPTPEGLYEHFKAVAGATDLPVMLYNVPGRTGCNIDAATCVRLASIPTVIGVKEASGNIQQMAEICRGVPDDFLVLSGDDAVTLPLMALGGRGVISVASNQIPTEMAAIVEAAERSDYAAARAVHERVLSLMLGNFIESSPGPVKFAMAAMGLCEEVFRLPMVPPRAASKERMTAILEELHLLQTKNEERRTKNGTANEGTANGTVNTRTANGTANERTADRTANERTVDGTANERTADRTANERTADRTANERTADRTANERTVDGTANERTADRTANERTVDGTANERTADGTANERTADGTANERTADRTTNERTVGATTHERRTDVGARVL